MFSFLLKVWIWVFAAGLLLLIAQRADERYPSIENKNGRHGIRSECFANGTLAISEALGNSREMPNIGPKPAAKEENEVERDKKLVALLNYGNHEVRKVILGIPDTWKYAGFSSIDAWFVLAIMMLWAIMTSLAHCFQTDQEVAEMLELIEKNGMSFVGATFKYLFQDFGYLLHEQVMHHKKTHKGPYGGILHWFRDTIEKMLSVSLVGVFVMFLARVLKYVYWWFSGEGWKFVMLPMDVNAAITIVGFALIIDSMILVSAMTDAPGIAETLDAIILALAGYVIMLVEAVPGHSSIVSFQFNNQGGTAIAFPLVTGVLFVIRWFVRNPTLKAIYDGRLPNQYIAEKFNNTGDGPNVVAQPPAP